MVRTDTNSKRLICHDFFYTSACKTTKRIKRAIFILEHGFFVSSILRTPNPLFTAVSIAWRLCPKNRLFSALMRMAPRWRERRSRRTNSLRSQCAFFAVALASRHATVSRGNAVRRSGANYLVLGSQKQLRNVEHVKKFRYFSANYRSYLIQKIP